MDAVTGLCVSHRAKALARHSLVGNVIQVIPEANHGTVRSLLSENCRTSGDHAVFLPRLIGDQQPVSGVMRLMHRQGHALGGFYKTVVHKELLVSSNIERTRQVGRPKRFRSGH